MSKLAIMIFVIASPTLAGIAMVAALVLGFTGAKGIVIAVVIGAVVALPVSIIVAKQIGSLTKSPQ